MRRALALLGLAPLVVCQIMAGSPTPDTQAREALETFLRAEFNGAQTLGVSDIRFDLVKYSPARTRQEKQRDPQTLGRATYYVSSPLVVAASYQVESLVVTGTRAKGVVFFHQLAISEGDGQEARRFRPAPQPESRITYNLVRTQGKWWVWDPPLPRISRENLIQGYKTILADVPSDWFDRKDISDGQKTLTRKKMDELAFLEGLPTP